jgi:hypothetical protein
MSSTTGHGRGKGGTGGRAKIGACLLVGDSINSYKEGIGNKIPPPLSSSLSLSV